MYPDDIISAKTLHNRGESISEYLTPSLDPSTGYAKITLSTRAIGYEKIDDNTIIQSTIVINKGGVQLRETYSFPIEDENSFVHQIENNQSVIYLHSNLNGQLVLAEYSAYGDIIDAQDMTRIINDLNIIETALNQATQFITGIGNDGDTIDLSGYTFSQVYVFITPNSATPTSVSYEYDSVSKVVTLHTNGTSASYLIILK